MKIKHYFMETINSVMAPFGYQVVHTQNLVTLKAALQRTTKRNIPIHTVIDVGASNGQWTELVRPYFPTAFYYLIEANPYYLDALRAYKRRHNNVDFVLAAAGNEIGTISFEGKTHEGGSAYHALLREGDLLVPMTTIDHEVAVKQLAPPFLLKLDTHGFEVPIFTGADETLKGTNLIVIEVYNFQISDESLKFPEMINYLSLQGFRPVDLCDLSFRPADQAFWQMDLFFIRSDRNEFEQNTYYINRIVNNEKP